MLRVKLSKFKQVCATVFLPRIFKETSVKNKVEKCSFDYTSKVKRSTNTGSNDEKYDKQMRIIEKCFEEKPVLYELKKPNDDTKQLLKDNLISTNNQQDKLDHLKDATIISTVFDYNKNQKINKASSDIEDEKLLKESKIQATAVNKDNVKLAQTTEDIKETSQKTDELLQGSKLQATTAKIEDEKLAQKLDHIAETPHVEAGAATVEGFNTSPKVLGQDILDTNEAKHRTFSNQEQQVDLDALAKRCLGIPVGEIDKNLLHELKNISRSQKIDVNISTDDSAQKYFSQIFETKTKCNTIVSDISNTHLGQSNDSKKTRLEHFQPFHLDTVPIFNIDYKVSDKDAFKRNKSPSDISKFYIDIPAILDPCAMEAIPLYEYVSKENMILYNNLELKGTDNMNIQSSNTPKEEVILVRDDLAKHSESQTKKLETTSDFISTKNNVSENIEPLIGVDKSTERSEYCNFSESDLTKLLEYKNVITKKNMEDAGNGNCKIISKDVTTEKVSDHRVLTNTTNDSADEYGIPSTAISNSYPSAYDQRSLDLPENSAISANQRPGEYFEIEPRYNFTSFRDIPITNIADATVTDTVVNIIETTDTIISNNKVFDTVVDITKRFIKDIDTKITDVVLELSTTRVFDVLGTDIIDNEIKFTDPLITGTGVFDTKYTDIIDYDVEATNTIVSETGKDRDDKSNDFIISETGMGLDSKNTDTIINETKIDSDYKTGDNIINEFKIAGTNLYSKTTDNATTGTEINKNVKTNDTIISETEIDRDVKTTDNIIKGTGLNQDVKTANILISETVFNRDHKTTDNIISGVGINKDVKANDNMIGETEKDRDYKTTVNLISGVGLNQDFKTANTLISETRIDDDNKTTDNILRGIGTNWDIKATNTKISETGIDGDVKANDNMISKIELDRDYKDTDNVISSIGIDTSVKANAINNETEIDRYNKTTDNIFSGIGINQDIKATVTTISETGIDGTVKTTDNITTNAIENHVTDTVLNGTRIFDTKVSDITDNDLDDTNINIIDTMICSTKVFDTKVSNVIDCDIIDIKSTSSVTETRDMPVPQRMVYSRNFLEVGDETVSKYQHPFIYREDPTKNYTYTVKPEIKQEEIHKSESPEATNRDTGVSLEDLIPLSVMLRQVRERNRIEACKNLLKTESQPEMANKPPPCLVPLDRSKPKTTLHPKPCPSRPKKESKDTSKTDPCKPRKCSKLMPFFLTLIKSETIFKTPTLSKQDYHEEYSRISYIDLTKEKTVNTMKQYSQVLSFFEIKRNVKNKDDIVCARNFDPWTPIPSWPIPKVEKRRPLVCPKQGCNLPVRPIPSNTEKPCTGMPKKISPTKVLFTPYDDSNVSF